MALTSFCFRYLRLKEVKLSEVGGDDMGIERYPSYLFGRIGSCDDTTGLFALEGGLTDYKIDYDVVAQVASSRDGYEINSRIPFEDGQGNPNVKFFNKTDLHANDPNGWAHDIRAHNGGSSSGKYSVVATAHQSMLYTFSTKKIADRRYINEVAGIVPMNRVIKTILRAKGVATKRIILFGASVPPEEGGALWVVSPHGFPWRDTKKHILDEGTSEDLENCLSSKDFLFMGMTGSVPFIAGHRQRQPDEEWPRILRIPSRVELKTYYKTLDAHLAHAVEEGLRDLGPSVDFATDLYLEAKSSGNVAIKPTDLIGEDTISLSDSDILI